MGEWFNPAVSKTAVAYATVCSNRTLRAKKICYMDTAMWFLMGLYILIGVGVAVNYWNSHSEKDRETAENGTTSFVLLLVTFSWPIKIIYSKYKKLL